MRARISPQSEAMLIELAARGIFGRTPGEVAGRFIDEALQRLVDVRLDVPNVEPPIVLSMLSHPPRASSLAARVLAALTPEPRCAREIAEHLGLGLLKLDTLVTTLSKLVRDGQIARPSRGYYCAIER